MGRAAAVLRVLAAAFLAVSGWALARAADDLVAGRDAIDAVRAAETADLIEGRPLPDLRRAERRLLDADRRLRAPLLAPVRAVPVVGRQLRSLATLSRTAATVAGIGVTSLTSAREVIGEGDGAGRASAAVARGLSLVAVDTRDQLRGLDLGPDRGLLWPVAGARRDLADQLADLDAALQRGAAGGRALATLLEGPRRYLVVAANNAEMRAGSGMFLSLGELETGGDGLRLGDMQPAELTPVPPGAVSLEGDLRDRWGWLSPTEDFRNLMLSPRFDVQAPLAARMWEATGHPAVDGVLSLDPVALEGMLAATGPITVDEREIDADSVLQELLHDQYVRYAREATPERRQQLGRLARAVFERLGAGGLSVPELARGLLSAVEGRHVLAWAARPEEQRQWAVAGIDGSLTADSLLVAVLNRGGNKLDQYLDVSSRLDVADAGEDTSLTVQVTLRNRAPTGEPRYIAGPAEGTGVGEGVYLGIVSVSLPGAAQEAYVEGEPQVAVAGPDGPGQVIGLQLAVGRGEQRTVVVRFRLPGRRGSVMVEPSARVPPVIWTSGRLRWTDSARHLVTWA